MSFPIDLLPLLPHDVARRIACASPGTWDHASTWRALSRALPEREVKEHERRWTGLALPERVMTNVQWVQPLLQGYLVGYVVEVGGRDVYRVDEQFKAHGRLFLRDYTEVKVAPGKRVMAVSKRGIGVQFFDTETLQLVGAAIGREDIFVVHFVDDACLAVSTLNNTIMLFGLVSSVPVRVVTFGEGYTFKFLSATTVMAYAAGHERPGRCTLELWSLSSQGAVRLGNDCLIAKNSSCAVVGTTLFYARGDCIVAWSIPEWRALYSIPRDAHTYIKGALTNDVLILISYKLTRLYRGERCILTIRDNVEHYCVSTDGKYMVAIDRAFGLWKIPF